MKDESEEWTKLRLLDLSTGKSSMFLVEQVIKKPKVHVRESRTVVDGVEYKITITNGIPSIEVVS